MNEIDVLDVFYDELRAEGHTRETLFLSIDEGFALKIEDKLNLEVELPAIWKLADICLANEWLERTTIDPDYRYLSLTDAGLKVAIAHQYGNPIPTL